MADIFKINTSNNINKSIVVVKDGGGSGSRTYDPYGTINIANISGKFDERFHNQPPWHTGLHGG